MTAYYMLSMLDQAGSRGMQEVVRDLVQGQVSWVERRVAVWVVYGSVFVH